MARQLIAGYAPVLETEEQNLIIEALRLYAETVPPDRRDPPLTDEDIEDLIERIDGAPRTP